MFRKKEMFTS